MSNIDHFQLMGGVDSSEARAQLLTWYDQNKRSLPWRDGVSPWGTWVSEIMLQQTRVSSVLAYYDRFMSRFPTPEDLANAEWDEVASLWAGLGYYRRAQNLWKGAKDVVSRHQGEVPSDPDAVRALTGVGPYTAGAILSIAFEQSAPLVDGNVMRVFARLYAIDQDIQQRETQKLFWALAERWVQGERPGDFNQSLMELGATLCTPKKPSCLVCPMRSLCRGVAEGDPAELPVKRKRSKSLPVEERIALVVKSLSREDCQPKYALVRHQEDGLLGGLWGLPQSKRTLENGSAPLADEIDQVLSQWGLSPGGVLASPIEHRFTHKKWRIWPVEVDEVKGCSDQFTWWEVEEIDQLGLGGPSLKVMRSLEIPLSARRGSGVKRR